MACCLVMVATSCSVDSSINAEALGFAVAASQGAWTSVLAGLS